MNKRFKTIVIILVAIVFFAVAIYATYVLKTRTVNIPPAEMSATSQDPVNLLDDIPLPDSEETPIVLQDPVVTPPPDDEDDRVDYEAIYNEYMRSGVRKKTPDDLNYEEGVVNEGHVVKGDDMAIYKSEIIDVDNDGIPELMLYAGSNLGGMGERVSQFCTIENGQVKVLLEGYDCGGSAGGNAVLIMHDTETNKDVICMEGFAGGFRGEMGSYDLYNYGNGKLTKIIQYSWISQVESNYSDEELSDPDFYYPEPESHYNEPVITVYEINDKRVLKQEYKAVFDRFVGNKPTGS